MYRANIQRNGVFDLARPLTKLRVRWRFQTKGNVWSSPVLAGKLVCFASRDRMLYALDARTSFMQWRTVIPRGSSAAPLIDGETIWIGGEDSHLYAIDLRSGEERMKLPLGAPTASSPLLLDDMLYIGTGGTRPHELDGALIAIEVAHGHEAWRVDLGAIYAAPASDGERIVVVTRMGDCVALDRHSGAFLWRTSLDCESIATPALSNGRVFVVTSNGQCVALDATNGEQLWRFDIARGYAASSPAATADTVFWGATNGTLYALDAESGAIRWQFRRESQDPDEPHSFGSPSLVGDCVYCGCSDEKLYVLDATSGKQRASLKTRSTTVWTSITLADDALFFGGGEGCVYACDAG